MTKILSKEQIRAWDAYTIESEPIASEDLMERAAKRLTDQLLTYVNSPDAKFCVLAGFGNNGGDALVIARLLIALNFDVSILLLRMQKSLSEDCQKKLEMVGQHKNLIIIDHTDDLKIPKDCVLIDGFFGSGLSRPLKGEFEKVVRQVNGANLFTISIDIPSGLDADNGIIGPIIQSDLTITFQQIKRGLLLKESLPCVGKLDVVDIGLSPKYLDKIAVSQFFINRPSAIQLLKNKGREISKIENGFGQLCGGNKNMLGALILSAKASLKSGIGRLVLTTAPIHHESIFTAVPNAMVQGSETKSNTTFEKFRLANKNINALAVGPGLGTEESSIQFLSQLLEEKSCVKIVDADALNIIAREKWVEKLQYDDIITPHEGEFDRLFGKSDTRLERIIKQNQASKQYGIIIILKGPFTTISDPQGNIYFNSTGNQGMAKGGSGDVLTGIVLSFLAQGYHSLEASLLGSFVHGLAGDKAQNEYGLIGMNAEDIISQIPYAIKELYEEKNNNFIRSRN